jgi:small conductance mechanosensitive channel
VPNNSIWGNVIKTITAHDTRRVDLVFGIGYDDDFEKAETVIRQVVDDHELVLDDPEPTVKLDELADSSMNIICRPWAKTSDYATVKWDILRRVKQRFDEEGISIPYPQREVHVHQANTLSNERDAQSQLRPR